LNIKDRIELPPDNRSDEITLQIVVCSRCRFSGIAIYEESRRGALNNDSYSHIGYRVNGKELRKLRKMIRRCPEPANRQCGCHVHQELGARDTSGRWIGIKEIQSEGEFELRL
jgi:hypothetical protein